MIESYIYKGRVRTRTSYKYKKFNAFFAFLKSV